MTKSKQFFFFAILIIVLSCNKSKDSEARRGATEGSSDSAIPGLASLTGTLNMSTDEGQVPAANAKVSVESHPEYSVVSDDKGNFTLPNVLPGTLTIYAEATAGASLNLEDSNLRSAQFKNIVLTSGQETRLPEDTVLQKPGTISGKVALLNNPQNVELVGIQVYAPGTSFSALTDEEGNFMISNVPAGLYDKIRFDKEGLSSSELINVTVESEMNTDLGIAYMALSTGPSGKVIGISKASSVKIDGSEKQVLQTKEITVSLLYDSRAVLMKIAHENSFMNVDWVPVSTTYTFAAKTNPAAVTAFSSDGTRHIYAKFADQNGLESSLYHLEFIIDTASPTVDSFQLLNGWDQIASVAKTINMDVSASDSGTGIKEMMLSNDASFTINSGWLPYAEWYDKWTPAVKTWIKVRDYVNRESAAKSDTITMGTNTVVTTTTFDSALTLYKAQSPYQLNDDFLFKSDLTIEPGTVLKIDHSNLLITVKGNLRAVGTASSGITIQNGSGTFNGFDLTDSASSDNRLEYITATVVGIFITINGGIVAHNTIDGTGGTSRPVSKIGFKALDIYNNTFSCSYGVEVANGSGATRIYNNLIDMDSASGPGVQQNGGTGTLVRNNTILVNHTMAGTGIGVSLGATGDMIVSYNDIQVSAPDKISYAISVGASGTLTLSHNNIVIENRNNNAHLYSNAAEAVIDATSNYYGGCLGGADCTDNPTVVETQGDVNRATEIASPITDPWPTTEGTGCVGRLCGYTP